MWRTLDGLRPSPHGEFAPLVLDLGAGAFSPVRLRVLQAWLPPSSARLGTQVAWLRSDGGSFSVTGASQSPEAHPAGVPHPAAGPGQAAFQPRLRGGCRRSVCTSLRLSRDTLASSVPPVDRGGSPCRSVWRLSRGRPGEAPSVWGTQRTSSVLASTAPGWASCSRCPFLTQPAVPHCGLLTPHVRRFLGCISLIVLL